MSSDDVPATDIAVVGMACRFPGASNPGEFWQLLKEGREARTELTDADLLAAGVPKSLLADPNYVKAGMFLQGMDLFDAGFFGFSPLDARIMDPQHRHFLECTWEALENAGYDPTRSDRAIGVFAGSGHNAYLPYNLLTNPELVAEVGFFLLRHTGNDKDFLATRASYCFDLKGPSVNVQTACSTSLVAVHSAAQSLLNGECDMALAGGVTIEMPHHHGYLYKDSEILSRDGHCRPFDASAGGTVFGSGIGVLVLKRLDDALADRDHIHAVIKASAVNNDGAGKISYLAPSVDGQAAAIHEALSVGGIDAQSVTYIECHGTGTPLGDPIEVAALTQAYGADNPRRQYCGLGSVKSNIGHTDTAAGVASLIKVIMALQHRQLPATLHYRAPNDAIDFANSPFYVNAQLRPWSAPSPLRAGVSSLGVGGTNAHVIVEEAPKVAAGKAGRSQQLLLLSARSEQSVKRSSDRLAQLLDDAVATKADLNLADVAYSLAVGRRRFRKRGFLLAGDTATASAALYSQESIALVDAPDATRKTAFMFAGGGAQYAGMGRELYDSEPVYRAAVDESLQLLRGIVDYDLKPLLYPAAGNEAEAARLLERPSRTLPALFVTQYAQAQLWRSMGVEPAALIGHSMGENTAACIAGVIALKDALGLVALRGKLFEQVEAGTMLSVELDEANLKPLLGSKLSLAAINAPELTVASGPLAALAELEQTLTQRGAGFRRIRIDIAAHSSMLDGILKAFGDYLRSIKLQAPKIPFISNLTGDWIKDSEATDPEYWVKHLRNTVRFADGVGKLLESGNYALLEVGPGRTLLSLSGLHPAKRADQVIAASLRHPDDDTQDLPQMLTALGRLWQAGVDIEWDKFYEGQQRRRVPLPTYAFDHARHWIEPGSSLAQGGGGRDGGERGAETADWLYQPVWQRVALPPEQDLAAAKVLVLAAADALSSAVTAALKAKGADVRVVSAGPQSLGDLNNSRIRFDVADDHVHLVEALRQSGWQPSHVLNLLPLDLGADDAGSDARRSLVFDSLFHLAQAAGNEDWQSLQWLVLSRRSLQVGGEAVLSPLAALALGPVRVLPNEFPGWRTRALDIDENTNAAAVVREIAGLAHGNETVVALRGRSRFVQSFQQRPADVAQGRQRAGGIYLITGGTGGLGLVAAQALAQSLPEKQAADITLVLLARRPLPERQYWEQLITDGAPETSALQKLIALEQQGTRVVLRSGDIANEAAMRDLAASIKAEFGTLSGIVHTAGVIDDSLLLTKDFDSVIKVLAPKVKGTQVLDRVFDTAALDFVVLYSSTSAFAGLPGQIDYAAANAFLDAFAHYRNEQGANYFAVNWPAWRQAGMAASLANHSGYLPAGRPLQYPLLDRCIEEENGKANFVTLFNVADDWVLHEHRIKVGPALIPGSGFIELARAAFAEVKGAGAIEIADAVFELPFFVADNDHKMLSVRIDNERFSISSDSFGDESVHAHGVIRSATPISERKDVATIAARCNKGKQRFDDADHHPFLDFGRRWSVLQDVSIGEREALIRLVIPEDFAAELDIFGLHPAVLDMATAGAQIIVDNYQPQSDLYVPIGYGRLHFNGRLPANGYSHVRYLTADNRSAGNDEIIFDIAVFDDTGAVSLTVDAFTMRRIPDVVSFRRALPVKHDEVNPSLKRTLELGIDSDEGATALLQIITNGLGPQTVVSPYRLAYVQHELLRLVVPEPVKTEAAHDADADEEIPAIEAELLACPAIEQVVVRSFLDEAGERRLVAFFVPDHAHYVTQGEVRRYARENVAAARLPQQWVELDELPQQSEGVVDRRVLADPLAPKDSYVAPRTTIEKGLARIWQDVLGVDRAGLSDNFFDLGGHSLLSTRVIVQIYKKFGVRLDQATMVLHTLEQVAREIGEKTGGAHGDEAAAPASAAAAPNEAKNTGASAGNEKKKGLLQSLFGGKK